MAPIQITGITEGWNVMASVSGTQATENHSKAALKRVPRRRSTVGAAFAKRLGEAAQEHPKSRCWCLQGLRPYFPQYLDRNTTWQSLKASNPELMPYSLRHGYAWRAAKYYLQPLP